MRSSSASGREHLARDVLRAAADGSNADAHATQVGQRLDPISLRAEKHERLHLWQPADKLEREPAGPVHALLHESELHVA